MRTFVVRLAEWQPEPGRARSGDPGTLRGVVDDVATGDRTPFRSTEELVALLETGAALVDRPGA